jgi:hypothetical protein
MRTVIIGLTLAVIVILLTLLALLVIIRAGIRRQERGACLICHPPGLTAAITRRMLKMNFQAPDYTHECRHAYRRPDAVANQQPRLSAKKGSAS